MKTLIKKNGSKLEISEYEQGDNSEIPPVTELSLVPMLEFWDHKKEFLVEGSVRDLLAYLAKDLQDSEINVRK